MKVTRIDVQILGERNFPIAVGRLTEEMSKDFTDVLESARHMTPTVTPEDVIRGIWRLGTRRLQATLAQGTPLKVEELPGVKQPPSFTRPEPLPTVAE